MGSPFPGVDPYLEDQHLWQEFHHLFITYALEAINAVLPGQYMARVERHVNLLSGEEEIETRPDLLVAELGEPRSASVPTEPGGVLLKPVSIPVAILDPGEQGYVKILRYPERKLVTVIELLSPSNKSESGRELYLEKRQGFLQRSVHLVELDLLLNGRRLPMARPLPSGDCYAFVSRRGRRPNSDVYSWWMRDKLPVIPIPLKRGDPDLSLDVAAVFATTYEKGRYRRSLDYSKPLKLVLNSEDRAWAERTAKTLTV
jgi:hypothetical protein